MNELSKVNKKNVWPVSALSVRKRSAGLSIKLVELLLQSTRVAFNAPRDCFKLFFDQITVMLKF